MIIFKLVLCLIICLLLQRPVLSANETIKQPFKVGFLMGGPINDYGWNQAHNDGRLYLEKYMSGKVQTIFAEKVPENSEAARIMERMISQGIKLIFLTTYGLFDPAVQVAARHPEVIFMQINRLTDLKKSNIGIYFPYYYEPLYAAGIVAGRKTKTNKIGFVIGYAVSNVLDGVNAFALGMQSVNAESRIHLVCSNSWNDPVTEAESTRALVESGADVIVSILDSSLSVCKAADKAGAYCIGSAFDLNKQVPNTWLTGQKWNYGPLYVRITKDVLEGRWKPETNAYWLKDGYAELASFGQSVPQNVRIEALNVVQRIKDGRLIVFRGPIKDAQGRLRVQPGKVIEDKALTSMDWVVPSVECSFSKK
jgi:basic membrane protein A and related proteins